MFGYARKAALGFVIVSAMLAAGCDMSTPSQYNVTQIRVKETVKTETLNAFSVDADKVSLVAADYLRNGKGKMDITMSYRSGDPLKEIEIRQQGRNYQDAFARNGVKNVRVDYVAMTDAAYVGQAVISYPAVVAMAPQGCRRIPGYQGADNIDEMEKYRIGCDTQTALSRMVAHPGDLEGNAGVPEGDSRRQGSVVEKYKAGTQNTPLQGLSASSIGSGG